MLRVILNGLLDNRIDDGSDKCVSHNTAKPGLRLRSTSDAVPQVPPEGKMPTKLSESIFWNHWDLIFVHCSGGGSNIDNSTLNLLTHETRTRLLKVPVLLLPWLKSLSLPEQILKLANLGKVVPLRQAFLQAIHMSERSKSAMVGLGAKKGPRESLSTECYRSITSIACVDSYWGCAPHFQRPGCARCANGTKCSNLLLSPSSRKGGDTTRQNST